MYLYIVTTEFTIHFFENYNNALNYAYIEQNKVRTISDDCVSYSIYPRVVIHKIDGEIFHPNDFLLSEEYAVRIFND